MDCNPILECITGVITELMVTLGVNGPLYPRTSRQLSYFTCRMGIIGEPMNHYNPITLAPQGAENEEEEHDDDEKAGTARRE